ncbi:MAG TPA: hypothetical protein VK879_07595 [Candidatus Sulfomarinibacteraceae bacterium]|nr:hypothetical protein [Candidatus Sulfomarinibacteraceae bacterium]
MHLHIILLMLKALSERRQRPATSIPLASPHGNAKRHVGGERDILYRQEGGSTRLLYLWDQSGGQSAISPDGFGYGREFDATAINQALRATTRTWP